MGRYGKDAEVDAGFGEIAQGASGRLELAHWLTDDGWSIKRTIRMLVLSRTYQLESLHDDHNFLIDPDNQWLWRMRARRLDAESLRDAVLTLSGDLECGVPPYGSIVAVMGDGCLVRQVKTDPLRAPTNHRSVYLANCRYFTPEVLDVFDGASSSLVVGCRTLSHAQSV